MTEIVLWQAMKPWLRITKWFKITPYAKLYNETLDNLHSFTMKVNGKCSYHALNVQNFQ